MELCVYAILHPGFLKIVLFKVQAESLLLCRLARAGAGSLAVAHGLPIAIASLCCGAQAQKLWHMDLLVLRHVDLPGSGIEPMFLTLAGESLYH